MSSWPSPRLLLALMGLLPWTATVTADEISFDGADLLNIDKIALP